VRFLESDFFLLAFVAFEPYTNNAKFWYKMESCKWCQYLELSEFAHLDRLGDVLIFYLLEYILPELGKLGECKPALVDIPVLVSLKVGYIAQS
jgi:hypothetical protein